MFDRDERDLVRTLNEMERTARERSHFDQIEARQRLRSYVQADRRFNSYDADALVSRVLECRQCAAVLDLDDPVLRGGERRPLDRSNW